jgi:hypothetical protein
LQPRVVLAGHLQRALGGGELDALALKARIELINALIGLGPVGPGVDLDFGDAVGQRLYLLLGVGKGGLARPQCNSLAETLVTLSAAPRATPIPPSING